jgi:hypothetical protein
MFNVCRANDNLELLEQRFIFRFKTKIERYFAYMGSFNWYKLIQVKNLKWNTAVLKKFPVNNLNIWKNYPLI